MLFLLLSNQRQMLKLKVATATLNQTPLDWENNYKNIITAIEQARKQNINLLALPELAITGYNCEDAFFSEEVYTTAINFLEKVKQNTEDIIITIGVPVIYENSLYNTVAVIYNKQILGFVPKQDLAGDGIYYEPRWFKKWDAGKTGKIKIPSLNNEFPIGDLIFEINNVRIAFEICEDAWNGVRPATQHYLHNVDIIINPSASNFSFGKSKTRLQLVLESSRAFKCTYLYTNLVGNEEGRIIFDGEMLIAQDGELLNYNELLQFNDVQLISAVVDIHKPRISKRKLFNFKYDDQNLNIIRKEDSLKTPVESLTKPVEYKFLTKEEEFLRAETLALFDYMRKSRSKGFVISLSGGADSSTAAILCALSIKRAKEQLSEIELQKKLKYWKDLDLNNTKQFLFCVYQKTKNNSEDTYNAAKELATELGAEFQLWDIQPFVDEYEKIVEKTIARKLQWEKDDLAKQNLQARVRVPALWMIANIRNALLITTSNRSESAVGYATMDGDTAGGLAPLAGIDKNFLLHWLKWAHEKLQIKALKYVIKLKPSAELRPLGSEQTDEKDLMPYDILDKIERLAIHEHRGVIECYEMLKEEIPPQLAYNYIRKFFTLWARNQWKRERFAPSFHLDDANLDPKTWFRFPILNGGYKYELKLLEKIVKS